MKTINWGIIGCGDVTEIKSGPAFNKVNHSRLVAVMRRNAAKAEDYAKRHGVPKWYSNAKQLIDDPEVNAIYIATPPLQHEEYSIMALNAGKPVYLEKPMAVNLSSAKRIEEAVRSTGVKLTIAHYRRQLPLFKRVKEIIDTGLLGDIRLINLQLLQPNNSPLITKTEENWRLNPAISGGGLFHDLAPHQLDLMIYFFGKVVKASGFALNQGGDYEADDTVQGTLVFESKALFNGIWSFVSPEKEARDICEIIGSAGKISFSIFRHSNLLRSSKDAEKEESLQVPEHIQQPMIAKVVQYFLNNGANPCSAQDGLEVMRLIDAFSNS